LLFFRIQVDVKLKEEELVKAQERMRALEKEVRKGVEEQRKLNAEHSTELNQMDKHHEATVASLREEVLYLEGKVSTCQDIMNDINIERLQKKMEQNAATARFMSCLDGCLVRQRSDHLGRRLCVWLWRSNYKEEIDLHEARKAGMQRLNHILSLWRFGHVSHVWSSLMTSFRDDKLVSTRLGAGEATLRKMKKRIDQNRTLSALLSFKSNKNAEHEAASQVSTVRAEMLEMERDATFTIEQLEEDKAILVANLSTLEGTLDTVAETGEMAAAVQSLTRRVAELQTEILGLKQSLDLTIVESERVASDASREISRERQHASDSVYALQADINQLKSCSRVKERELDRAKEDFAFTINRMARTAEVASKRAVADALRDERLKSPGSSHASPGSFSLGRGPFIEGRDSHARLVSKEQIVLDELRREGGSLTGSAPNGALSFLNQVQQKEASGGLDELLVLEGLLEAELTDRSQRRGAYG